MQWIYLFFIFTGAWLTIISFIRMFAGQTDHWEKPGKERDRDWFADEYIPQDPDLDGDITDTPFEE